MLPIKEAPKSESEDTPPPSPKEEVKSEGFVASDGEDFIPENVYETADAKIGDIKDYESVARKELNETASRQ